MHWPCQRKRVGALASEALSKVYAGFFKVSIWFYGTWKSAIFKKINDSFLCVESKNNLENKPLFIICIVLQVIIKLLTLC